MVELLHVNYLLYLSEEFLHYPLSNIFEVNNNSLKSVMIKVNGFPWLNYYALILTIFLM
jgi:hypothetical protein